MLDTTILVILLFLAVWCVAEIIKSRWKIIRYSFYSMIFHMCYWPSELLLWLTVKLHAVERWTLDKRDVNHENTYI